MGRVTWRSAALGLVGVLVLFGCGPKTGTAEKAEPPPAPAPPPAPVIPPPLARAELLQAVGEAASATAAGAPTPEVARAMGGRSFSIRLPFGCGGPSPEKARLRYAYDADKQTLRLAAQPVVLTEVQWVKDLVATPETEAIEGFWVDRPWILSDACPAPPAEAPAPEDDAAAKPDGKAKDSKAKSGKKAGEAAKVEAPPAPPPQTVGLVQVFDSTGSRVRRRDGRGYEATKKITPDQAPGPAGFRLVLEGRLSGGESGPVRCRVEAPDQRPVCLVMAEIDRVAIESATGEVVSEWRN